jgi:hypothetical protein
MQKSCVAVTGVNSNKAFPVHKRRNDSIYCYKDFLGKIYAA